MREPCRHVTCQTPWRPRPSSAAHPLQRGSVSCSCRSGCIRRRGGAASRSGLAVVHSGEPIFSTYDAEKLWRFVHDLGETPINTSGVYSGLARKMFDVESSDLNDIHSVSIDNSINIPGGIHVHGEQAQQLIALLKEVVAPYQPNV